MGNAENNIGRVGEVWDTPPSHNNNPSPNPYEVIKKHLNELESIPNLDKLNKKIDLRMRLHHYDCYYVGSKWVHRCNLKLKPADFFEKNKKNELPPEMVVRNNKVELLERIPGDFRFEISREGEKPKRINYVFKSGETFESVRRKINKMRSEIHV